MKQQIYEKASHYLEKKKKKKVEYYSNKNQKRKAIVRNRN